MNISPISTALALLALCLPSCAPFKFPPTEGGDEYRLQSAYRVKMLTLGGERRLEGFSNASFEGNVGYPKVENLVPEFSGAYLSEEGSSEINAGATAPSTFKEVASGNLDSSTKSKFKRASYYKGFWFRDQHPIVQQLNDPANANWRERMKALGGDARIITGVVKVFGFGAANEVESKISGQIALTGVGGSEIAPVVKGSVSNSSSKTFTLDDNHTYAYEYSRIFWDESSGKENKIKFLRVDRASNWFD